MKVHEIMTPRARCVNPDNSLVEAAGLMRELDVGALPVCDNERLVGMVTDRDLVVRGVANGCDAYEATIREVMSQGIVCVSAEQEVEEAVRVMEEKQIRRLPVVNREKRLVGMLAMRDLALSSNFAFSGHALREVSETAEEHMRGGRSPRIPASPQGARDRNETGTPGGTRRVPAGSRHGGDGGAVAGGKRRRAAKSRTAGARQPAAGKAKRSRSAAGAATERAGQRKTRGRKSAARGGR